MIQEQITTNTAWSKFITSDQGGKEQHVWESIFKIHSKPSKTTKTTKKIEAFDCYRCQSPS